MSDSETYLERPELLTLLYEKISTIEAIAQHHSYDEERAHGLQSLHHDFSEIERIASRAKKLIEDFEPLAKERCEECGGVHG